MQNDEILCTSAKTLCKTMLIYVQLGKISDGKIMLIYANFGEDTLIKQNYVKIC